LGLSSCQLCVLSSQFGVSVFGFRSLDGLVEKQIPPLRCGMTERTVRATTRAAGSEDCGRRLAGPGVGWGEGGLLAAEEADRESSEEEAADVGHVGDASVLDVGDGADVDELHEEPKADEKDGGDIRDADEEKEEEERTDAVAGKGDEEGSHDGGDGAAGTEGGDVRAGRGGDLGEHRDQASEEIEGGEAEGVHGVFHRGTEGPEEDHVAEDMRPASMQKHGSDESDETVA